MSFYHGPQNFVSKVVSIRWNTITMEEEIGKATSRGQKTKR
jgi:hypothetical protein